MRTALEALKVTKDQVLEQARRDLTKAALKVEEQVEQAITNGMTQVEITISAIDSRYVDSITRLYRTKGYRAKSHVVTGFIANGYFKPSSVVVTIAWGGQ